MANELDIHGDSLLIAPLNSDSDDGVEPALDTEAPTSTVDALPSNVPEDFTVTWYGSDNEGGSGVASYDVFVSTDGGEFTLWQDDTTAISGTYDGQPGSTYDFYSVATDNSGNVESSDGSQASTNTIEGITQQPAIYRLFNSSTGVHLYTSDVVERNSVIENLDNYVYEGVAYFAANPDNGVPVYRLYNQQADGHFYTTSEAERDEFLASNPEYVDEGSEFNAFEEQVEGTLPVYRFFDPNTEAYFYTSDEVERESIIENLPNYTFQDVAFYTLPVEADSDSSTPPPTDGGFTGAEVGYQSFFPDFNTLSGQALVTTVGDGVEFNIPANGTETGESIDISGSSIIYQVTSPDGSYAEAEVNGISIFDPTDNLPAITNVTIDESATTLGVDSSDILFNENVISLNFESLPYVTGDTVKLDVEFADI